MKLKGLSQSKLSRFIVFATLCAVVVSALIVYMPGQTNAAAEKALRKNRKSARPDGWSAEAHSSNAAPNYDVVFPHDRVNQLTIRISRENWKLMQDNMTRLFGERRIPLNEKDLKAGRRPNVTGKRTSGVIKRGYNAENPVWVPAAIEFNGKNWQYAGLRYKGNVSLMNLWDRGDINLPFKLEFDRFEDKHPEVKSQRFYGFRVLSFSSNFGDNSAMRERIAYAILKEAGLVASETGYYEVQLDYGDETPVTLGLYTAVEETDDTVIRRFFGDDNGNIYKADGYAANLAKGTFEHISQSFIKKNNKKKSNWSDIEALYKVLHSAERTDNPMVWRSKLEAIFDVNVFLKWLAVSALIQHWDSYGSIAHNYYLYNNQQTGRLTFISWDHNRVLADHAGYSFDRKEIGSNWPLIRFLLDDPSYYNTYINYFCEMSTSVFKADMLAGQYRSIADMLAPYESKGVNDKSYDAAVRKLTEWTYLREKTAADFCHDKLIK
ncbi:MAG: CotH kinase family protein [Nitrospirae bacterium]|nr:CotH kinase family protein [Nitrospirota bacterium]